MNKKWIKDWLKSEPFSTIIPLGKKKGVNLYIVGGTVRDLFLGRPGKDYDFVLNSEVHSLAKEVALCLNGSFIPLGEEDSYARVAYRTPTQELINLDFTKFHQGSTIEEDINGRDFTINAMAIDLEAAQLKVIDPLGGAGDLKKGIIRGISEQAFKDDPLRMLRAVRLSSELGFEIEEETKKVIARFAFMINHTSIERVTNEIYLILKSPDSAAYIDQLEKLKLLKTIFPEIIPLKDLDQQGFHHLSGWEHTMATLKALEDITANPERFFPEWAERIKVYLGEIVAADHTRLVNLKLGALFHDLGKPQTRRVDTATGKVTFYSHDNIGARLAAGIGNRLRLSNKEIGLIKVVVKGHMRPGFLVEEKEITDRALYRFFRDMGDEGVSTLILSLADRYAALGEKVTLSDLERHHQCIRFVLDKFYCPTPRIIPPRLLKGNEIMEQFSLRGGYKIGQLLDMVEEAIVEGKVKNKEEALDFVGEILKENKKEERKEDTKKRKF